MQALDTGSPLTVRRVRRFGLLRSLGPGLVSGAADDDPGGIATYSQAGAQLGAAACWVVLGCLPMMIVTQEISARIGRAAGTGVVGALGRHYPRAVVRPLVGLIALANVANLGADLGAMGTVLRHLLGGPSLLYAAALGALCAGQLLFVRFETYVRVVRWGSLSLLTYVVAALVVPTSWGDLLPSTAFPLRLDSPSAATVAAVLGTTISPYLFVWQSSLEAERARGLPPLDRHASGASLAAHEIKRIRVDTGIGMAAANVVALAVVTTAAGTLHAAGITDVNTAAEAAAALRPVAGPLAFLLFSFGILGTGLLAVPMLAGSAAYALAEERRWPAGLALPPRRARGFYGCAVLAMLAGVALNALGLDPVRALIWSAMANGLVSVPVLAMMLLLAAKPDVMGRLVLSPLLALSGWIATAVMAAASFGLLATLGG